MVAKIRGAVFTSLLTQSMLLIAAPVTFVDSAALVFKHPEAIHLVHRPLTLIDVSVRVLKFAVVGWLAELPLSSVDSSIFPGHRSESMAEPA